MRNEAVKDQASFWWQGQREGHWGQSCSADPTEPPGHEWLRGQRGEGAKAVCCFSAMHEVNLIFVLTTTEVRQVHFPVTLVKFLLLLHDIEIKNWVWIKFLSSIWQKPLRPGPVTSFPLVPKVQKLTRRLRLRASVDQEAPFPFPMILPPRFSLSNSPSPVASDPWGC